MKVHEYNEMMAYMLRPRQKFAIGGRIGFTKGGDFRIALQNLINEGDVNFKSIQDIFDKTNTPRTANLETIFTKEFKDKFNVRKFTITQFANEQGIFKPSTFQRILGPVGQKSQPEAYKIITKALEKAGIILDKKMGGTGSDFENVTKETMDLFNKEVTKLRSAAGLPMTRYQTEKIKDDIKIFVEDKLAKGEYVSRPVIKEHFGIGNKKTDPAAKGFDMLITRSLGLDGKAGTGLLKELGQEEKAIISSETGKKVAAAKLQKSDDILKAINDEFKFDPDISDSEELAKKIYGSDFDKLDTKGKLELVTQTDNDVMKYLRMLRGTRGEIPKGLRLPSQEKIADIIFNIETGLEDEAGEGRGKFKKKGFRFSTGVLRDYKFSLIDEILGLEKNTFANERRRFVTKGFELDEIFGLSSSSKYAPGYAEAIQLISKEANQAKKTEIDRPLAVLLKAIDEGKTTVERKVSGKKIKIPISQAVEEFNKKSSDFAKKYNIRGPKINLGGNFDLNNYIKFRPESQKNIEETFKNKNYFLSEVNNKPFETLTQRTKLFNLKKIPGVTTADKAPIPEATKTRNMFKRAGKLGLVGGLIASTAGKTEEKEQQPIDPTGMLPQTKEQNPSFIEEYPYLVGTTAAASPLLTKTGRKIYGGVLKGGLKAFGSVPSGLGFSASQFVDINPFSDEFGELQEDPNIGLAGADLLLPELGKRVPGSGKGIMSAIGRGILNPFQYLEGLSKFGRAGRIAAMGARIPTLMTPVGLGLMGIEGVMMGMREQERINQMRETDPEAYQEYLADQEDMLRESAAYGGRMGFDEGGPSDPSKRKFMKIMGGLASLPVVGKFFRVAEQTPVVQNIFTEIQKLKNSETIMPDWFPTFLDKFRREGVAENIFKKKKVEVSKAEYDKAFAEGRGQDYYTDVARTQEYKANNPDHMDYYKLEDTDELIGTTYTNEKVPGVKVDDFDGEVSVNWENDYSQPVSIEYVKPGMQGSDLGRLDKYEAGFADRKLKPEGEFAAVDQEVYATDPDGGFDTNPIIVESLDDMMEGTTRVMEEYATGKPVRTLSKGEGKVIEAELRAEQAAESAAEMADDFDDF